MPYKRLAKKQNSVSVRTLWSLLASKQDTKRRLSFFLWPSLSLMMPRAAAAILLPAWEWRIMYTVESWALELTCCGLFTVLENIVVYSRLVGLIGNLHHQDWQRTVNAFLNIPTEYILWVSIEFFLVILSSPTNLQIAGIILEVKMKYGRIDICTQSLKFFLYEGAEVVLYF